MRPAMSDHKISGSFDFGGKCSDFLSSAENVKSIGAYSQDFLSHRNIPVLIVQDQQADITR